MKRFVFAFFLFITFLLSSDSRAVSHSIAYIPTTAGVMLGNGGSVVTGVAPGTSGSLLVSNGSTWLSSQSSGIAYAAYASRPAAGVAGRVFLPTDGPIHFIDTGLDWKPLIARSVSGTELTSTSGWTSVNANGLTIPTSFAFSVGRIGFTWDGNGADGSAVPVRFAYKTAPSPGATGYRVSAHFTVIYPTEHAGFQLYVGLGFRESSTGSVESLAFRYGDAAGGSTFAPQRRRFTANNTGTSPTFTAGATVIGRYGTPVYEQWVRIERNNSGDRASYYSPDNLSWRLMSAMSSSANDFITPDQIIFECDSFFSVASSPTSGCYMDSYEETTY